MTNDKKKKNVMHSDFGQLIQWIELCTTKKEILNNGIPFVPIYSDDDDDDDIHCYQTNWVWNENSEYSWIQEKK